MKTSRFGVCTLMVLILLAGACATAPSQFFESAPGRIPMSDRGLFSKAMSHQKKGQIEPAIGLWEKFLGKYPNSYEARNNLGLLYYANDEITLAISQFEQGLNLEGGSAKIKDNLLRALKVRVAILEENKEYDRAIIDVKRIAQLSPVEEQEKIERDIEGFEDKIFEQVKKSDLLEEYKEFLEKYPNSPKNSDEARLRVEELQQSGEIEQTGQLSAIPESDLEIPPNRPLAMSEEMVPELLAPEEIPDTFRSFPEETIEIVEESVASESMSATPVEEPSAAEPAVAEKPIPMARPVPAPAKAPAPPPPPKMVEIIKAEILNVRSEPEIKTGNIVYQLKKGAKITYAGQNEAWYQVEYAKGKKGWISKKYSKLLE